jgi:hypothetical protein
MEGMTLETRLLIGLDDLKSVQFVCKHCGARATRNPARAAETVPMNCGQCSKPWRVSDDRETVLIRFLSALGAISQGTDAGCDVVLEVDGRMLSDPPK